MPTFIIVEYLWQILETGGFFGPPIREKPRKPILNRVNGGRKKTQVGLRFTPCLVITISKYISITASFFGFSEPLKTAEHAFCISTYSLLDYYMPAMYLQRFYVTLLNNGEVEASRGHYLYWWLHCSFSYLWTRQVWFLLSKVWPHFSRICDKWR